MSVSPIATLLPAPAAVLPQGGFSGISADVQTVLVNLAAVLVLGQVLAWHYVRFAPVLSNKRKFARTFVFIAVTTMLVITIVKTSLALSLGLVGALSIIRFRTPIKEPEELAYLFVAIAIGLGFGAFDPGTAWSGRDLRLITVIVFAGLLVYLSVSNLRGGGGALPPRILLHVTGEIAEGTADAALKAVLAASEPGASRVDLRRMDSEGTRFEATLALDMKDAKGVGTTVERVQSAIPGCAVSVVDGAGLE